MKKFSSLAGMGVPWHIQRMKYKLQKAFERKNVDLILKYSADIGHITLEMHMFRYIPLKTTMGK